MCITLWNMAKFFTEHKAQNKFVNANPVSHLGYPFKILHGMQDSELGFLFMHSKRSQILFINSSLEFSIILFPCASPFIAICFCPFFAPRHISCLHSWVKFPSLAQRKTLYFLFVCWTRKKPPIKRRNLYLGVGSWDTAHVLPTKICIFWLWNARK